MPAARTLASSSATKASAAAERVERLAQTARRAACRPLEVVARDDDDVDVAVQIEMLKPVVEHVDGAAE